MLTFRCLVFKYSFKYWPFIRERVWNLTSFGSVKFCWEHKTYACWLTCQYNGHHSVRKNHRDSVYKSCFMNMKVCNKEINLKFRGSAVLPSLNSFFSIFSTRNLIFVGITKKIFIYIVNFGMAWLLLIASPLHGPLTTNCKHLSNVG